MPAIHSPSSVASPLASMTLGHEQLAGRASSRHAPAVVRECACYAGHVGAVAVAVVNHRAAVEEVSLLRDLAYVGMILVYPRIDDGDLRPGAPGVVPGAREPGFLLRPHWPGSPNLRVVRLGSGLADVVVVGGLDAGIFPKVPELSDCSSCSLVSLDCSLCYARERDETRTSPRKILQQFAPPTRGRRTARRLSDVPGS